jgi:protein YIPF6
MTDAVGPAWADARNHPVTVDQHVDELFQEYSTLDEPVRETILRDVRAVQAKLKVVLSQASPFASGNVLHNLYYAAGYAGVSQNQQANESVNNGNDEQPPANGTSSDSNNAALSEQDRDTIKQLKDWDLWGPLFVCLLLAVTLSIQAPTDQANMVFAAIFCTIWLGSAILTLQAQLLGATNSFFQTVCVLGYCIFPLTLASLLIGLRKLLLPWSLLFWVVDVPAILLGFLWSTRVSTIFMGLYIRPARRFLALYPVFFFYTFLAWMILLF